MGNEEHEESDSDLLLGFSVVTGSLFVYFYFLSISVCEFGLRTLYYFKSAYALHLALIRNVHEKMFLTTDGSTATTQLVFICTSLFLLGGKIAESCTLHAYACLFSAALQISCWAF